MIHQTAHATLWGHIVLIKDCQNGIAEFLTCTSFIERTVTEKYNRYRMEETANFKRAQYRLLSQNNDASNTYDGLQVLNYSGSALEKLTYVRVDHTWKIERHQLRRFCEADRHIDDPSFWHLMALNGPV